MAAHLVGFTLQPIRYGPHYWRVWIYTTVLSFKCASYGAHTLGACKKHTLLGLREPPLGKYPRFLIQLVHPKSGWLKIIATVHWVMQDALVIFADPIRFQLHPFITGCACQHCFCFVWQAWWPLCKAGSLGAQELPAVRGHCSKVEQPWLLPRWVNFVRHV